MSERSCGVTHGLCLLGMVHVLSGAKVSKVEVMAAPRLTVDCSNGVGTGVVVSCALSCSVRWFLNCSGSVLCSLRDLMMRGGGRGGLNGMASSMKSCPAMKGASDCENEAMCCDFFVMNRSSVVCD